MKNVQCKNCVRLKAAWCAMKDDSPDPELIRDCRYFKQITEHDHICAMSNEEMAEWLFGIIHNCEECFLRHICDRKKPCYDNILAWLRSAREG